jgi:hypothetical protein
MAALFEAASKRAGDAAGPCALAMAKAASDHTSRVTLRRYAHDRLSKTPAPTGGPPAAVDGRLAGSFVVTPGPSGGSTGRAIYGPTVVYSRVQQFGAEIFAKNRRALMWRTSYITPNTNLEKSFREGGGTWLNFARHVHIPERDYLEKGLEEAIASGALERAKAEVFMRIVWGE